MLCWQELAVQNEVGLVNNPLKISWLEGQPQGAVGFSHPGLSQVRSQASPNLACSEFGGPFPVWALLRALSLQMQVMGSRVRWAGPPTKQGDCGSVLTCFWL